MHIRKVTPVIGAEIEGVDLSRPLGNETFQFVHDALMDNLVVFFRDQALDYEQQVAFGRLFGELHVHPAAPSVPGHPEVMVIHADANSKFVNGERWPASYVSAPCRRAAGTRCSPTCMRRSRRCRRRCARCCRG